MTKTKKRRGLCSKYLVLALVLLFVFFAMPLAACSEPDETGNNSVVDNDPELSKPDGEDQPIAAGASRVVIYYFRKNADYTNWNVWLWPNGVAGGAYDFCKSVMINGVKWRKLVVDLPGVPLTESDAVGFIVRKGEWDEKDPDMDRYIKSTKFVNNRAEIYVVQGREGIYDNAEDAYIAATSHFITSARLTKLDTVTVATDVGITEKSIFKVKSSDGTVIESLDCSTLDLTQLGKKSLSIPLHGNIDITDTYTVVDEPAGSFDKEVNYIGTALNKSPAFSTPEFSELYDYSGELGVEYSQQQSVFRVWTPIATAVKLNIYAAGDGGEAIQSVDMTKGDKAVWSATVSGDLNGKYYTYTATVEGATKEVVDPYARSAGKNGKRGMILDLDTTDPTGWDSQTIPFYNTTAENMAKAVIYEAHLRDLTIHESSNVTEANRGKFLGMTESGTAQAPTPLDYIADLGVTAVHFQPLFDFATVDESFTTATYNKDGEYNWGYDPLNYNIPEGSYSSDPSDGAVRVNEMKQMIMALHNAGIQVVMDVVYNHVSSAQSSNFEALVPGYYFRKKADGTFYNGSGCGNETASERYMFRKFMIDSVKYWNSEYKIDGFRFDLMGLHDIDTMNELYDALKATDKDIIIYGEGWTGGDCGLSAAKQAVLNNAAKMPNIALFDDIMRDGIKGGVFTMTEKGFVTGVKSKETVIYVGAAGGTGAVANKYYTKLSKKVFASNPTQNINYVSCHDNSTLWDKMNASVTFAAGVEDDEKPAIIRAMYRMAAVSVLTSQGGSFFLAGEELMRSKPTTEENTYDNRPNSYLTDEEYFFSDNSYRSPDSVNAINWDLSEDQADMVAFYKALIAIKKTFKQFQIADTETLTECLHIVDTIATTNTFDGVAVYAVKDPDSNSYAIVIFNTTAEKVTVDLLNATYSIYVNGDAASAATPLSTFTGSSIDVNAYSAVVMTATLDPDEVAEWEYPVPETEAE